MSQAAPTPASAGDPTPAGRRPRRAVLAVVATLVAVVVVIATLAATGLLHFGGGTGSPANETFFQASGSAQSGANSIPGGPWVAVIAWGLVTRATAFEPITNVSALFGLSNCTTDWIHGVPANVVIPATPTSAGTGAAAFWGFVFKNASNELAIVTVDSGSASALVVLGGPGCTYAGSLLDGFGPGLEDSSAIVGAVNTAGGARFLTNYPNATQAWLLVGTIDQSTLPIWTVVDTSCTLPISVAAQGAFFNASVIATTATLRGSPENVTANCALPLPGSGTLARALPPTTPTALRKAI